MTCPLCNDTGDQRYWEGRWRDANAEIAKLRAALERSVIAINDWLHQYAGDLCNEESVAESAARVGEYGTIGYIADVLEQNRCALEQKAHQVTDGTENSFSNKIPS